MKKLNLVILACGLTLLAPAYVLAQGSSGAAVSVNTPDLRGVAKEVEIRAKVVSLDMARRTATLKYGKGRVVVVGVPPTVRNFDQVRVGDELSVRYATAVVTQLEHAPKSGIRERIETVEVVGAGQGGRPGIEVDRTIEILADIQSINKKNRQVVLRGAERTVLMAVSPNVDMQTLKIGDQVRALYMDAAMLTFEKSAR